MRKLVWVMVIGILLSVTMVFASPNLVMWQFFGVGSATQTIKDSYTESNTFYAIVRAAEKDQNASVNITPVEWGNYYTIFNQALASHKAGDIDIMHVEYLMPYAKAGLVANISKLAQLTGTKLDEVFDPPLLKAVSYKGNVYAMRWDVHAFLWHINKAEFAKAGLLDKNGNPIIPTTPEEFIAEAEKYKAATGQPFVYADNGESSPWEFYSWLLQNGGHYLSDGGWKAGFNTKEGIEVLKFMTYLPAHGLANFAMTVPDISSALENGKVASIFEGTWMVNTYAHALGNDLYVTNLPTLYHVGPPTVWANSHSFVIPNYLPIDRQIKAFKFLLAMEKYNLYWGNTGHIPVVQLTKEDKNYLASLNGGDRHYFNGLLKEARPLPQPFAGDPWGVILPYLQKSFAGKVTPEAALQEAEDALNRFISQQR